ncbi:MAG: sugar ABC transporter ATP-binding protein [Candidatus Limiplasma sp.]|nr:sugar ABC transporter ATP-binding protein [Candidatus Limiplasma sp.]
MDVLFSLSNIVKQYPGTLALNNVSMEIHAGEVVGLVGENGAGKSTLLKIMMGIEMPTEGGMMMRGEKYAPRTPMEANHAGVGMVFQEQALIANLTVAQNIFIGQECSFTRFGFIHKKKMRQEAMRVLHEAGVHTIRPEWKVSRLDYATRQMVEIAKVFHSVQRSGQGGAVILLDEPTSVLSESEVTHLFSNVRALCEAGNAVVFISHRLDEVLEISDRIYIFKDGCNAGELMRDQANEAVLYEKMVGKTASGEYYKINRQRIPEDEVVLELKNLGQRGYFKGIDLALRRGEVVGICGVIGSGKENLCAVICGDEAPTEGEIRVKGACKAFRSPYQALASGILSIPKERRAEGIIADRPAYENICMANFAAMKVHGLVSDRRAQRVALKYVEELSIKLPSVKHPVGHLSGGNAQKVVFARMLASDASVLVLNHPTRGVDVGAKEEIYSIVRDITQQGKSVIVLGDTLDECIGLSNRILVMKDGEVTKVLDAPARGKPEQLEIIKYMM